MNISEKIKKPSSVLRFSVDGFLKEHIRGGIRRDARSGTFTGIFTLEETFLTEIPIKEKI